MHVGKPLHSLPQFCCLLATITALKSIPDFLLGCRFLQPGAVSLPLSTARYLTFVVQINVPVLPSDFIFYFVFGCAAKLAGS